MNARDCAAGRAAAAPVVVACAADSAYAMPLAAMLDSLSAHADPARRMDVHIIDCGLSPAVRARIDRHRRSNLRLRWHASIRPPDIRAPRWGHVSAASYDRLLIDRYVPEGTGLVLWLDCDLLVQDDVATLFDRPPVTGILRAVTDPLVRRADSPFGVYGWRELGLAPESPYFNAGVMLIDLNRWRASDVPGRALQRMRRHPKRLVFNEQEALNAVIGEGWEPIEDRWNCSANPQHARQQNLGGTAPAIIHFAGRTKPWIVPDLGPAQDLFFLHLDKTAWRGTRPRRTVTNRLTSWYLRSRLRRLGYPLENHCLRLRHHLRW